MPRRSLLERPLASPIASLAVCFFLWKALLLSTASLSPGVGYDTSTAVLFGNSTHSHGSLSRAPGGAVERLALRLTRWDAIYFVKSAERGHVHEQDWAFSWALARLMSAISNYYPLAQSSLEANAVTGILLSHLTHLLSVLVLHRLALLLGDAWQPRKIAFVAAFLHIISPAGMFLSAPYAEAPFAFLNFSGMLLYVLGLKARYLQGTTFGEAIAFVSAGTCFGLSAMVRSNGLFSGLLFAYDALVLCLEFVQSGFGLKRVYQAGLTVFGGSLIAVGFVAPQIVAYKEYCTMDSGTRRIWCDRTVPSIYTWVQDHYWNVGFLRYWTLSNAPLFALAAPMLYILIQTGLQALSYATLHTSSDTPAAVVFRNGCFRRLAVPQLLLAALALTSFHVQVITRIASGYPLWYIACASWLCSKSGPKHFSPAILRWMIVYGVVQGGLYASFLPPA